MYICICNAVTDRDIRQAVANGACSLECLRERLAVSACCGQCAEHAAECLESALLETEATAAA
jgi:bacterioferritin-associated ferredoxin